MLPALHDTDASLSGASFSELTCLALSRHETVQLHQVQHPIN